MGTGKTPRRAAYLLLCAAPAVIGPLAGARPLRIPIVHEALGAVSFGVVAVAVWSLARATGEARGDVGSLLRAAGALLVAPWALISLFWVGLGTPWDATPSENATRYAVLLAGATGVTGGFFLLREALSAAGERLLSALGLALCTLSGAAYLVWTSFQLGYFALRIAAGAVDPAVAAMNDVFDGLLFAGGALAWLATAAFAYATSRAGWLGRGAARAYVLLSLLALALLALRGVSLPVPGGDPAPWFTRPGFVVGIPAVPWLLPYFLGVIALRRSGDGGRD